MTGFSHLAWLCCLLLLALVVAAKPAEDKDKRSSKEDNGVDDLYDDKHGIKMGVPDGGCDDAKTNLDADWDGSAVNYTCYNPQSPFLPIDYLEPKIFCEKLPKNYFPQHFCMSHPLSYKDRIPTHGDHRPLWPKFGEYKFVPRQRWLHNIEHGSVVMLYHPCALRDTVDRLRAVVKSCIRKHVITPYDALTKERPLALVAWGCRYEMSTVDEKTVVEFIRKQGLKGPEGTLSKQGQYDFGLLDPSPEDGVPGSDVDDSKLCPRHPR